MEGTLKDYIYQTSFEKTIVKVLKGFLATFSTALMVIMLILDPTNLDKYVWGLFECAIIMMQDVKLDPLTRQMRRNVTYR